MDSQNDVFGSNIELISNSLDINMFNELQGSLKNCTKFIFSVAFINFGGLQLLLRTFDELRSQNIRGKILTSDYQNFTDPKALRKLYEFENIEKKVYLQNHFGGFHTKAYIFEYENEIKLYIGSSNITESALLRNVEWNIKVISKIDNPFVVEVMSRFEELWNKTTRIDSSFLDEYENFIKALRATRIQDEKFIYHEDLVTPNKMQVRAITNLHSLRTRGENKGLVIAATATGKTYMSAFDVKQFQPKRMLFIVHREDILNKAIESFKRVLGAGISAGVLSGTKKETDKKYLFSTIQSMLNRYTDFKPNEFDYIVVDESHHATAESYQKVLNYFRPKFILGMTATPERSDGLSLFSYFENNVALEVRLYEAIESELVCPFHYFGVTEAEGIDYSDLNDNDINKLTKKLNVNSRVNYIVEKLNLYGHDGEKLKCLGFCASIEHAVFMENSFNELGIRSIHLSGNDPVPTRESYVKDLESDSPNSLEVIFTVDVFNEGIDIPSINTILMLRPTNSPIVFIQQIGRGLRKIPNKKFVTIIDFIGNYRKSFLIAVALKGSKFLDKDSIKVAVKTDFGDLPGSSFVQMDEIAKEEILRQLDLEDFSSLKYLRDEYLTFKKMNRLQIPIYLMQYELLEGSPDPIRFINYSGNYLEFILKIETNLDLSDRGVTKPFLKITTYLSSFLPLKRPTEFYIIDLLMKYRSLELNKLSLKLKDLILGIDDTSITHAIKNLQGHFLDSSQLSRFRPLIVLNNNDLELSTDWYSVINQDNLHFIEDIIKYGLRRYDRDFNSIQYSVPFLNLYSTYRMTDVAILSNETKKTSSYRGQGVITHGSDYFLFIELNKSENIREEINYKDKIINTKQMVWESQNKTKQSSNIGQNLIHNKDRSIILHVFVRKFKKVDGLSQPYVYLGKVNTISCKNDKPIEFTFEFEKELPKSLYNDLTNVVDSSLN